MKLDHQGEKWFVVKKKLACPMVCVYTNTTYNIQHTHADVKGTYTHTHTQHIL